MNRKLSVAAIAGFVIGAIWLVAIRYVTYTNPAVHWHANFALYINGRQDKFDNFTFYEEVQSCNSDDAANPKSRVHLHDNIATVVHVHDASATWGDLFANLGYTLGDSLVKTDQGVYVSGQNNFKLTFILNGSVVEGVANRTIASEDNLLINYGQDAAATLQQRFNAIPKDAGEYNQRNDPSSCKGTRPKTFTERLKDSVL